MAAVSEKSQGEKLTLSMHWLDEEGWAGDKGKRYLPGDSVTLENSGHAMLLREAGYAGPLPESK